MRKIYITHFIIIINFGGDFVRKDAYRIISAAMYILSFISFFCLVRTDISSVCTVSYLHMIKFITAFSVFVFGYAATVLRHKSVSGEKMRQSYIYKTTVWFFIVYCFIVFDFTLMDNSFGRRISSIFSCAPYEIREYLIQNTNVIPFDTIVLFIRGYMKGVLPLAVVIENTLGNLLVFAPFALFLPIISKRYYRWRSFSTAIALSVLFVEVMQLIFLTGSMDIDDFLLNVSGALIMFAVFKVPKVGRVLNRLTFGAWDYER